MLACLFLWIVDILVFLVGFGTCVDQPCPSWHEWLNTNTFFGVGVIFAVIVLMLAAATVRWTLMRRHGR
jgi:uncharacterized membrane protein YedE/YeeE